MNNLRLTLVDADPHTGSVLMDELAQRGFTDVELASNILALPALLQVSPPDVVIFNYHADQPDSLMVCCVVKLAAPMAPLVAVVSSGPALTTARAWARQTKSIDVVIDKSLNDNRFFATVRDLLAVKANSRGLAQNKAARLASPTPRAPLANLSVGSMAPQNEAETFEAAVLFTDIRGSSQLIQDIPPGEFFAMLNSLLSEQAQHVSLFEGSVIKYTGDGVMAIFKGAGRSCMALNCALELAKLSNEQKMPFGIGLAQGLVLAGLIGDSRRCGQRRQYDVIGATVHLASRLCSMANASEVISTTSVHSAAKIISAEPHHIDGVVIRGFDQEISCVAFNPER